MTALNAKQRVKINAALAAIHVAGHKANDVTAYARQLQSSGHDPRTAYERAINRFIVAQPAMANELGKLTRLIEASDDNTVAQYDGALTQFIETGDDAGLQAMAPTIARDSIALAVQLGEVAAGDDLANGLEAALGCEPTAEMIAAYSTAPAEAAPATTEKPAERFSFTDPDADPGTSSGHPTPSPARPSNWSETGYMAPKHGVAAARWYGTTVAEASAIDAAEAV